MNYEQLVKKFYEMLGPKEKEFKSYLAKNKVPTMKNLESDQVRNWAHRYFVWASTADKKFWSDFNVKWSSFLDSLDSKK